VSAATKYSSSKKSLLKGDSMKGESAERSQLKGPSSEKDSAEGRVC
jgi:hypothetical protein